MYSIKPRQNKTRKPDKLPGEAWQRAEKPTEGRRAVYILRAIFGDTPVKKEDVDCHLRYDNQRRGGQKEAS